MNLRIFIKRYDRRHKRTTLILQNGESLFVDDVERLTVTKRRKHEEVGQIQVRLATAVRFQLHDEYRDRHLFVDSDGFLVYEYYDELVFTEPTALMLELLKTSKTWYDGYEPSRNYEEKRVETRQAISEARKRISNELEFLKARGKMFEEAYGAVLSSLSDNLENNTDEASSISGGEESKVADDLDNSIVPSVLSEPRAGDISMALLVS